ncbi:hypothetical protein NDI56_02095 [Haloarcula sp. S1CR25-12]|uniref:SHOCT domain-containing protein n=1 Tax=Haloarcula saliterrae TaxID=2950534 RepID=A0ABU2F8R5_9EURY|nr:hypothetical protein [Haloarcula sp. S1CR25-12]MDS0258196.1 hypothetical protein [Haloarcula sp. S1CR25-12]
MTKAVNVSLSTRTMQYLVAVVFVGLFAVPVIGGLLSLAGVPVPESWLVAVGGWVVLASLWVRRVGGRDDDATWAAIPSWQYDGRFAEAGGLTRSEQEEALDELRDEQ